MSIAPCSATSRTGFSLAEIIVSLALISLIMLSIDRVMVSATRYLKQTSLTTELQQSCVLASSRLVTELLESNAMSIRGDGITHRFVSFGSARNSQGQTTFDPVTSELNWHFIVGYYIAMRGDEPALYRKDEAILPPATIAPTISGTYDQQHWIDQPQPARMIANRVYYLDVLSTTTVDVILAVKSLDGRFLININTKLKARN